MNSSVPMKENPEAQDANARRRICDELDQNFMVEAAAGTGKTTSIVNRMVSLITHGACPIDQLAAVTFTRKAAAELRERFQLELRRRAVEQELKTPHDQTIRNRLLQASDDSNRAFVGTIHSFCAAILRERPVEFGIDPAFREISEKEDQQLREIAWIENISDLIASQDPLMDKLDELGIDRQLIKNRLNHFIDFRDVEHWPHAAPPELDLADVQRQTREYIQHMQKLLPLFPASRGTDKLMDRYESIVRSSGKDWGRLGNFFDLLEKFDHSDGTTQKWWHDKPTAKSESLRWQQFRDAVAKPAMRYWCRVRYEFVVDFLRRAVTIYERLKTATGGLDFNDLLLATSRGLRSQPELRKYFQSRYTHLLVDEFQDTDPIQAEIILYLTSRDVNQKDWQKCHPNAGALFLVGDPKQSIYRFRRGDIVTYNRVKELYKESGGEVLALVKNFRSRTEVREWNNRVYRDKFLPQANQYTPAAEDMVQGRVDQLANDPSPQRLCGVYRLSVATDVSIDDATHQEATAVARFIRHAIDAGMRVPRTAREIELGLSESVSARDFLIIPWGKKRINTFRSALESYGIPSEITGGNAFHGIQELSVLIDCLRAMDDPHNPLHFLAVLRDGLWGFSDRELYQFKKAGGRFSFTAPVPDSLDRELKLRFEEACERFRQYQAWLRALPFSSAVSRVAEDLGLLSSAAAGPEGNVMCGGFLKALEWVRQQESDFDCASDLISFFEELLDADETEGCTALPPDADVVRVMNLHKAKGLEAPVVFLVDTSMRYDHPVLCHIDRTAETAVGYMGITTENGRWAKREIAAPDNWSAFQAEEQRYLDAEADRLLYVATTRAACAMIVSMGKNNSNWSGLYAYLQDAPEIEVPPDPPSIETRTTHSVAHSGDEPPLSNDRFEHRWAAASQASYAIAAAKDLGLHGSTRPRWEATGDYGYQWGSAVHELLEIRVKSPLVEIRPAAITLTREYNLGSSRVDELIETVESVTGSEIWQRAQAAGQCFSELPFESPATSAEGLPTIVRGVIDLVFEEPQGWVIVDYKTDDITQNELESARDYYQKQLEVYSRHWQQITGFRVHELGLYFTRINAYVAIPCS